MLDNGVASTLFTVAVSVAGVALAMVPKFDDKLTTMPEPSPVLPSPAILTPSEAGSASTPCTNAVTKAAPLISAVAKVIFATPLLLVSAVPVAGSKIPKVLSFNEKLTNLLARGRPLRSFTIAVTNAGVAAFILILLDSKLTVGLSPDTTPSPSIVIFTSANSPLLILAVTVAPVLIAPVKS